MTVGITRLVIRSPPHSGCTALRSAFQYTSSVTTKPVRRYSTTVGQMLAKANRDFEANGPPPKNALSKQLFPSSSPTPSNSDIRDQMKKRGGLSSLALSPSAGRGSGSLSTSRVLDNRAPNATANSGSGAGGGSFASLYSNSSSSFKNPESFIDLTASDDIIPTNKVTEAVEFDLDDFSDDDGLDLEFQVPKSLPALPADKIHAKENMPPPPSSGKQDNMIPWSSSPAAHFLPPDQFRSVSGAPQPSTTSLKRESSGEGETLNGPSQKKPKRRVLPASFQAGPEAEPAPVATPKPKVHDMWDPTASATKEQKRQLKRERSAAAKSSVTALTKEEGEPIFQKSGDMADSGSAFPKSDTMTLSSEQRHVLNMVVEQGKSVFFTGPAGTGKSVLMRAIIQELRNKHARDSQRVAVTASTGLAACNIGGVTLHSFAGVGLGKEPANALVKKVRRNPKAKSRWLATKCLIIDEISMVDGELFDKLSQVGRTIRNNGRPWGGIQLIVTGDFLQLPPVPDMDKKREPNFAFDAQTWDTSIDHTIGLTQVFRQRDPEFAQMLNEMRLGKISDKTVQAFKALSRPLKFDDGVDSAELFPTRNQVEYSNQTRLRELPGESYRYDAADAGKEDRRDKLLSNMMAPKSIELKLNAQVMLIKNLDDTLVNGSLGKVIGFSDEKTFSIDSGIEAAEMDSMAKARKKLSAFARDGDSEKSGPKFPVVQFVSTNGSQRVILCQPEEWKVELPNGEVEAKRSQIPLILAWALSIHKAQGQTLDRVTVNLGRVFEHGQAYVALSRATTKNGLRVLGFERSKVMAHNRVVDFYKKLYSAADVSRVSASTIADFIEARKGVAKKPVQTISIDDDAEEAMAAHGY